MSKRKTRVQCLLLVALMCLCFTGCKIGYRIGGFALNEIEGDDFEAKKQQFDEVMVMITRGTPEDLSSLAESSEMTFDEAWEDWNAYRQEYGDYVSYEVLSAFEYDDDTVLSGSIQLENGTVNLDVQRNENGRLTGLCFYRTQEEDDALHPMPETVEEKNVVIGEGGDYPLQGVITLPKGAQEGSARYPAVVLIHGNGTSDMDMSGGATRMFRDIAWGLAERGIVVIRYDKRSYTYPDVWTDEPSLSNLTVDWEIVDDAVLATDLLRQEPYVDQESVYLLGHSLGALIAPRIDEQADYAGEIMLAVPDTTWQDAAYHQYLNYGLANLKQDDAYYACRFLESQKEEIDDGLKKYSDDMLLQEVLLGMPAAYWKDLTTMDYVDAITHTEKPILLLQGELDYQIRMDENFEGWQKKLKDNTHATLISYPELNHLFMRSQGFFMGNAKEYDMPNHVQDTVISDIADFILE